MKTPLLTFFSILVSALGLQAEGNFGCSDKALLKYISIQQALANDDLGSAKTAAAALEESGQSCPTSGKECCLEVTKNASEIGAATSIDVARSSFKGLSDTLIANIEAKGLAHGQVYKMYCPMAFGNTGATWIQDTKALRNPYFGASMLMCGMQQAEIGTPVVLGEVK